MEIKTSENMNVYLPSKGGTICGFGIVRDANENDTTIFKKVFENKSGRIFFNTFQDRQVRGIKQIIELN